MKRAQTADHNEAEGTRYERLMMILAELWFHERRWLFVSFFIGALLLFVLIGAFLSTRRESSALADYEASVLLEEIAQTDFSKQHQANYKGPSPLHPALTVVEAMTKLSSLTDSCKEASEHASAVLAQGAIASNTFHQTVSEEKFNSWIKASEEYFRKIAMDSSASFLQQINSSHHSDTTTKLLPRQEAYLKVYQAMCAKDAKKEVRLFFQNYPELTAKLETIWGQKIDQLYESLN